MLDGRTEGRLRALVGARIIFSNGSMSYDCLIRNLSRTGAKLIVDGAPVLPEEFELLIPTQGRRHRARLRWRNATQLGVVFLPQPQDGVAERLAQLETENDLLRRQIAASMRTMALHALGREDPPT